jgi:hypothetical protein
MVDVIFLIFVVVVVVFAMVVAFGAPYLPTLSKQAHDALDLLDLKPGQTLLELGSGDGRVLLAAAKQGIHGVGYELNPLLVVVSRLLTWRYRKTVTIHWGNYWAHTWPRADGIYVFLLDRFMSRLDTKVTQWQQGSVRVVSYAFAIPGREPARRLEGLYLYNYAAPRRARNKKIEN